jgi:hypothetical protein
MLFLHEFLNHMRRYVTCFRDEDKMHNYSFVNLVWTMIQMSKHKTIRLQVPFGRVLQMSQHIITRLQILFGQGWQTSK